MSRGKSETPVRWEQPGVCACQDDGPWHAHYSEGKHGCARCSCDEWRPTIRPVLDALIALEESEQALEHAEEARRVARLRLAKVVGVERRDKDMAFDAAFEAKDRALSYLLAERKAGRHV